MNALLLIVAILALVYLLLRFNSVWIYATLDHATRNRRDALPPEYELPRYVGRDKQGRIDLGARWPGWDGWYFFVIPDDRTLPPQMIRGSIMTGLYGLEGIDNYNKLLLRLQTYQAAEFVSLIPTMASVAGQTREENNLSHQYLPRATDLSLETATLAVEVRSVDPENFQVKQLYGRVEGAWPNYRFEFDNPEGGIHVALEYSGGPIVWWADIAGIFTYFAAFGSFAGKITYRHGTTTADVHQLREGLETYAIRGSGSFEHGFARKLFDYDPLFQPVRLLKMAFPSLKTIRYHYELLVDDSGLRGGFMKARGFGIDFRNRGGFHLDGKYVAIDSVNVEYDEANRDLVTDGESAPTVFYRRWMVTAATANGPLTYTATREFAPANLADSMTFHHFRYEGNYAGRPLSGRGYGEYVHI